MQYQNVTGFPAIFFDPAGRLRTDILKEILQFGSVSQNLPFNELIKRLFKILTKKNEISTKRRLEKVLQTIPDPNFRLKWYRLTQKNKKLFVPFYNFLYFYIVEKCHFLRFDVSERQVIFWSRESVNDIKPCLFLRKESIQKLIDLFQAHNSNEEIMTLYLWAFIETHTWHNVGFRETDSPISFINELSEILTQIGCDQLLRLCLPPEEHSKPKQISDSLEMHSEPVQNWVDASENLNCELEIMKKYRSYLMKIIDYKETLKRLTEQSNYSEIRNLLPLVEEIELNIILTFEELKRWQNLSGFGEPLPDPPLNFMNSSPIALKHLQEVSDITKKAMQHRETSFKTTKALLVKEIENAGLTVPEELNEAISIEGVLTVKRSIESSLKGAKVLHSFLLTGFDEIVFKSIPYESRKFIYSSMVTADSIKLVNAILTFIVRHEQFSAIDKEKMFEEVLNIAELVIEAGDPLPSGFWNFLKLLVTNSIIAKIDTLGWFFKLEKATNDIDLQGLDHLVGNNLNILPPKLADKVIVNRIMKLNAPERILKLSQKVKHSPNDPLTLKLLFKSLCELSRFKEAIYFSAICIRLGLLEIENDELCETLFMALLDVVDGVEIEKSLLYELFDDMSYFTKKYSHTIALLYILQKCKLDANFINMKYQYPEAIDLAKKACPLLTARLLLLNEKSLHKPEVSKLQDYVLRQQAMDAIKEFEKALMKPSCYRNWPPAVQYQHFFRRHLQLKYEELKQNSHFVVDAPEDIIELAKEDGKLPSVTGDATLNMKRFLRSQIERLLIIESSLDRYSIDELLSSVNRDQSLLNDDLQGILSEADTNSTNILLQLVYEKMLEEQKS